MRKSLSKKRSHLEEHSKGAALFKEFILGGQDGLVNVLGILLGIATATQNTQLVIVAGLAATFAESISMGAVAYTSTKAQEDYYYSEEKREENEIARVPEIERKEVYEIYYKKGFRGKLLNDIVKNITSDKKRWKDTMMKEELNLSKEFTSPIKSAIIVLIASFIGSIIPLMPFFFFSIKMAIVYSLLISSIALFTTGAIEAKFTLKNWFSKGLQLMLIGMGAALIGFIVGKLTGFSG